MDVCAGISAPTVAWKPLGWSCAVHSEIDPAARAVLAHHYPGTPLVGDFTQIRGDEHGTIDLLVGGTPCQSFSVAGLRGGMDDHRGNLALEYLKLADRARPRWLVWENVPGVLSSSGGRDFGSILGGLGELGYGWAYRVLDAQFAGVPQRRRRVFVVGHLGDWRRAAAVLFERHSLQGHPAPRREKGQNAPTIPSRGTAGGGLGTDFDCDGGLIEAYGGNDTRGPIDVATARNGHGGPHGRLDFESETFIAHSLRADGFDASEGGTGRGTPLVPVAFNTRQDPIHGEMAQPIGAKDNGNGVMVPVPILEAGARTGKSTDDPRAGIGIGEPGDPMFTLQSGKQHAIAFDTTQVTSAANRSNPQAGDPCHPLAAGAHAPAIAGSAVRRLTPVECLRLQGFPDTYFDGVMLRGRPLADGPKYKLLGNSMAVPVMHWIGERIAMVDAIEALEAAA